MSFTRLFVHFDGCRNASRLEITSTDNIVIHTNKKLTDKESNTVEKVIGLLEDWSPFKGLNEAEKEAIEKDLRVSADQKKHTVKVEKIRNIYHRVIGNHLKGFEKAAWDNINNPSRRIVANWHGKEVTVLSKNDSGKGNIDIEGENSETFAEYRRKLIKRYGENRVDRIMQGHGKNYYQITANGRALRVSDVLHMTTGLVDFHERDLQDGYEKIIKVLGASSESKRERAVQQLPRNMRRQICSKGDSIVEKLQAVFNDPKKLPAKFNELKPEQIKYIINLIAIPFEDLEKTLLGKRIEGVVQGVFPFSSRYTFFYSKLHEDRGRIQAIQEVMEHKDKNELFFLEMWTKLFVKKEVSKTVDLLTGMIVPAPDGEWYRIVNKKSSHGKFVFCLEPLSNPSLPSYIMQRSTASSPSSSNPVWTIIQDTNPFAPPGYFNKKVGLETEFKHFYEGKNDLVISGHSLGGSFTQLNMINFIKKMKKDGLAFPERNIKLVIFDSPALTKKDALYFARWAKNNPKDAKRITIEYYFSRSDAIPAAGRYHLGVGCEETNVKVKFTLAEPKKGATEPELKLHPHGRYFFRTKETINSTHLDMKGAEALRAYDNQPWRLVMEIIRRIVGAFIFSALLLWLGLKTIIVKAVELRSSSDRKVDSFSRKELLTQ